MTELDRLEIIRRHLDGASFRAIARAMRIDRKTVAVVIRAYERERHEPHSALPRVRSRRSQLDAYAAQITALLDRYPDITAVRLDEELRAAGFTGARVAKVVDAAHEGVIAIRQAKTGGPLRLAAAAGGHHGPGRVCTPRAPDDERPPDFRSAPRPIRALRGREQSVSDHGGSAPPRGIQSATRPSWSVLFRHTFASRLLAAGCPMKTIGDLLGHVSTDTTMEYANIDLATLRDVALSEAEVRS